MLVPMVAGTAIAIVIEFPIKRAMPMLHTDANTNSNGNSKAALERVFCLFLLVESCKMCVYGGVAYTYIHIYTHMN